MTGERRGPLKGLRILEATHMLAGPYCGMLLADLGAEVIKIESPDGGDIGRRIGPHMLGDQNLYFASLNRNKQSVRIDLATARGQARLGKLAATAHGLVTNMRPAAIRKLGLTYETLKAHNPKIACLALTGFGLDGPYADRPAYDYIIQALSGAMALAGDPDGPPVKAGYSVVDNSSGIMGALGLVAKIHEGGGGQIDVSLYDTMISQLNYLAVAYLNAGEKPKRYPSGGHPYIVPAQIFATSDGYLALFITHDEFWRRFATEVGREDWIADPDFATMTARSANRDRVVEGVGAILAQRPTEEWMTRLAPLGLVVAGVEKLEQALESELCAWRKMVVSVATPNGPLRSVGAAIKIVGEEPAFRAPPSLGQDDAAFFGAEAADDG
ncbi:MAG: CoA transferase [Salinarimonadaceae bacterium]|nr:MAG: CoA transferase [Salinarimonadaceae bacterium]